MKMVSNNYTRNKNLQKALHEWASSCSDWNYFVTFIFNNPCANLVTGRSKLQYFSAKIDHAICGMNFRDLCPYTERNFFIAFPEHPTTNLHYHALLRTPDPELFREMAADIWEISVPGGDIHIRNAVPDLDAKGAFDVGNYITKESYQELQYGSFIISSEFGD